MICIHHNKDMDGFCSGAIVKHKYPDCKLIGWDYKDEMPDFNQFQDQEVLMIDITFPLDKLLMLSDICKLTVIDHHISFKKQIDELVYTDNYIPFTYIYEADVAACEIGWKYLFPETPVPYAVTLISRYDTWRQQEGDWAGETLPFKYYMYGICNSVETFPEEIFHLNFIDILSFTKEGKIIMRAEEMRYEALSHSYSFERDAYGYQAIILNSAFFSSETLKTKYNPKYHDLMVGFCYTGTKWSISLRSDKPEIDVSIIARKRGGGGHKGAAGFEVNNFEDIFE